jgi:hypothetical protein
VAILGADEVHYGPAGADGGAPDATPDAAAFDYHDMTDPSFWSTFDISALGGGAQGALGAATFDGRYYYFAPGLAHGYGAPISTALRYDSQGAFNAPGSWTPLDLKTVYPGAGGFTDATFDGRYVYFVPYQGPPVRHADAFRGGELLGIVRRLDREPRRLRLLRGRRLRRSIRLLRSVALRRSGAF